MYHNAEPPARETEARQDTLCWATVGVFFATENHHDRQNHAPQSWTEPPFSRRMEDEGPVSSIISEDRSKSAVLVQCRRAWS